MTEQSEAKIQEEEKHFYRKPSTVRKIANLPRRPTFAERISDFFMRIVNPGAFEDKSIPVQEEGSRRREQGETRQSCGATQEPGQNGEDEPEEE